MANERVVLAFGTFDLIHPGHLFYLNEAKKLGSKLVVVVARDETVEKLKKKKPFFNQESRLKLVSELKPVDKAVLGHHSLEEMFLTVKEINPETIALGYDQTPGNEVLEKKLKELGWIGKIVRIKAVNEEKFKSSKIRESIKNGH